MSLRTKSPQNQLREQTVQFRDLPGPDTPEEKREIQEQFRDRKKPARGMQEQLKEISKTNKKRAEQLRKQLNNFAQQFKTRLEFDVVPELDQLFVQVRDARTDSLRKMAPAKHFLKHRLNMQEFQQRVLDRQA